MAQNKVCPSTSVPHHFQIGNLELDFWTFREIPELWHAHTVQNVFQIADSAIWYGTIWYNIVVAQVWYMVT